MLFSGRTVALKDGKHVMMMLITTAASIYCILIMCQAQF